MEDKVVAAWVGYMEDDPSQQGWVSVHKAMEFVVASQDVHWEVCKVAAEDVVDIWDQQDKVDKVDQDQEQVPYEEEVVVACSYDLGSYQVAVVAQEDVAVVAYAGDAFAEEAFVDAQVVVVVVEEKFVVAVAVAVAMIIAIAEQKQIQQVWMVILLQIILAKSLDHQVVVVLACLQKLKVQFLMSYAWQL